MTEFIQHLRELYHLWQQASLYPRVMSMLLLLSPVIFTVVGIGIVNYRIARRAYDREVKK